MKRKNANTPKLPKVLYSVRVDGELDVLLRAHLDLINTDQKTNYTMTDMVNGILYDCFFDLKSANNARKHSYILNYFVRLLNSLHITRMHVKHFFTDISNVEKANQ
jgi:hypothetical protein